MRRGRVDSLLSATWRARAPPIRQLTLLSVEKRQPLTHQASEEQAAQQSSIEEPGMEPRPGVCGLTSVSWSGAWHSVLRAAHGLRRRRSAMTANGVTLTANVQRRLGRAGDPLAAGLRAWRWDPERKQKLALDATDGDTGQRFLNNA